MSAVNEEPEYSLLTRFIEKGEADNLFEDLFDQVDWDTSMKARKTACYGESYDDSGVNFAVRLMHPLLEPYCSAIQDELGFLPTNCLLNYYQDGKSTMGFHSDTVSYLEKGTGIAIVSLGSEREITFRNKDDYGRRITVLLPHGSLFYMTQLTQEYWTHAIKKSPVDLPRISLTFRRILAEKK